MNWKKTLIGCSIASAVFVLIAGISGFFVFRHFLTNIASRGMEMPSGLENPAILKGSGFLSRSPFFEDSRLGSITDIAMGEFDASPGVEIAIAGSQGAVFLDEDLQVKSSTMFGMRAAHVDFVDVDGDNVCEYLDRGGMGWSNASLVAHDGTTMWTYGGMPGVDDMAAGDIDGNGRTEFVVGFNGGGGVHLLDESGKKTWQQRDGNVWHVEMVDTDGDGTLEIVHSNAGGQMTVRDATGTVLRRTRPGGYFSYFSLCRWPSGNDPQHALLSENDTIWLFDFDGGTAAKLAAPECGRLGHARGTPVRIIRDQPEYLAVVVAFSHWKRAVLYVYDSNKALAYQEILPETCSSIAAISLDETGAETLLIGGEGKVWQYRLES